MTDKFGNYTIVQRLGVGGMATVDRAHVTLPDGKRYEVALKRILPHLEDDDRYVDLFLREANLAAQLRHPRIVKVFEQGWVGTTCFIALELLRGDPLMVLMYEGRKARVQMPVGVMLSLMIELCDMLDYVHHGEDARGEARRIVHRDLTPANLIIEDTGHLKVIDFGVAKTVRMGKSSTDSGQPKGKLGYMPLEALQGKQVDARADIFSIGVVMWEMLCGRRLFKGTSDWEVMDKVRTGHVPPPSSINPDCPTELDAVVLQAVARDFFDRWPSAGALKLELEHVRRNYEEDATPEAVIAWKRAIAASSRPEPVEMEEPEASRIEIHDQPPADDEISAVNMDGFADAPFMSHNDNTVQSNAYEDRSPTAEAPMFLDEDDTQP